MTEPKPRRRARTKAGQYKGDNPDTSVNEAWEAEETEAGLPKEIDYSIKPKIEGPSGPNAGKYSKQPKVRPTFGKVSSVSY